MKKLIVLLWVVFLPTTPIMAQSEQDKQEVYDQLKEWAVVKLTIAYMEDLKGWNSNTKKIKTKEFETYKTLIIDFQYFSIERKILLEDVSQTLEEGDWRTTKKKVFDAYKYLIIDSGDNSEFSKIPSSGYNENISNQSFIKTISVLEKRYDDLLNEKNDIEEEPKKIPEENKTEKPQAESANENPLEETREITSGFPFWVYGVLGSLIVAIIIIFILFSSNNKLKQKLKNAKDELKKHNTNQGLFGPESEKLRGLARQHKTSEDKLNKEIENFKKEIEILKNRSVPTIEHTTTNEIIEIPSEGFDLEVAKQNNSNLIFLSSPFQNLTFANEDASKGKTSNSLYQVDFNEQMQTGGLTVLVDADLSKALNSPDTYLETACTYDNEYSNNARAIKVIESGEIKLDGEDWIVTKKVRIKFI